MTSGAPKVVGVEPAFRHLDDIEWTPVQRQQNADGSVSVVREKWPIIRPGFLSAHVTYEAGMVVRRHRDVGHHLVRVLAGGAWFGERWCPAGTHIELPVGGEFGPSITGDEGAVLLELTDGRTTGGDR